MEVAAHSNCTLVKGKYSVGPSVNSDQMMQILQKLREMQTTAGQNKIAEEDTIPQLVSVPEDFEAISEEKKESVNEVD